MKTVIGLDYGTQSARALLVDTADGRVLLSHTIRYPHGVMEGSFASIEDYDNAFFELLDAVVTDEYRDTIAGICVDATSLTLVPVSKDGQVLAKMPEFAGHEQAQIKLWKRHAAQTQADEALEKAVAMGEKFLGRTGGSLSSEWTLPKMMEAYDEDREVYDAIDIAFDLCEYLTWKLTGNLIRSVGSMSFKGVWAEDIGLPSEAYLNSLRPGFAEKYNHVMRGEVLTPSGLAGTVCPEIQQRFGLGPDVKVAAGVLDGHTSMVSLGSLTDGCATLVLGTSTVLALQSPELYEVMGICGIAKHGAIPGVYGIDAGQNCSGDMLEWYMENMLPFSVWKEAQEKGVSPHNVLADRVKKPWECKLTVADWWNGSRNAPCDLNLRGAMTGFSLETRPEDIYLALLQATVCGTREIMETCAAYGMPTKSIRMTGGIAGKNPLLVQLYADIFGMPVEVGQIAEGPAMGSAIFAAVAAGVFPTVAEAYEHMGVHDFVTYTPDPEHREDYEALYRRNHALRLSLQRDKAAAEA